MKSLVNLHLKLLIAMSIIAGVFYSSWPLGHWLNSSVSKSSLASGLEAVGQPFNWIFIGGDIGCSVLIIIVCILLWQKLRFERTYKLVRLAIISTGLFGLGTIADALLPLRCVQGIEKCPSFTSDHQLLVHGIFSILASVFLFIGLLILWFHNKGDVILNTLMIGYIIFGIISLAQAVVPGKNGNWSQDYYITLCSIWIALLPYIIHRIINYS